MSCNFGYLNTVFKAERKKTLFDTYKHLKVILELSEVYDGSKNTLSKIRRDSTNQTRYLTATTKGFYTDFHCDPTGTETYFYINEVNLILI